MSDKIDNNRKAGNYSSEWWHDFFGENTHLGDGRKSNPPYISDPKPREMGKTKSKL